MRIAAIALAFVATPVAAQQVSSLRSAAPDVSALQSQIDAAKATADAARIAAAASVQASDLAVLQAQIPRPADIIPPTEMIGGTVGTAGTYRPADAAQPRITRAGVVSTDASGGWSITWSSPLATVPTVLPVPINATTQPIICNVATRSTTAAAGRCWLARTLPATLLTLTALVTYDVFGAPVSGVSVQVIALPPTQ